MSQVLLFQSEDDRTKLDVRLENQTLWLSQKQLTEVFGKFKGTISEHIKHFFKDGELEEFSVVRQFRTTSADGKTYEVAHYNLDNGFTEFRRMEDYSLESDFDKAVIHLPPPPPNS